MSSRRRWIGVGLVAALVACSGAVEREGDVDDEGQAEPTSSSGAVSSSGAAGGSSGAVSSSGAAGGSSGAVSSSGAADGSSGAVSSSGAVGSSSGEASSSGGASSGAPPAAGTTLVVGAEVGASVSLAVAKPNTSLLQAVPRGTLPGCPATLSPSKSSEAEYVTLTNDSDSAVNVEVDLVAGSYDFYVAGYAQKPASDDERRACLVGRNCFNGRTCLTGERRLSLGAQSSVEVYLTPVTEGEWPDDLLLRARTVGN